MLLQLSTDDLPIAHIAPLIAPCPEQASRAHFSIGRTSHCIVACFAKFYLAILLSKPLTNSCAMKAVIPINTLRDYIAYARLKCQPELTEEAGQDLVNSYLDMRQQGISRSTISATPRQLESMVRLSEALARMRLSPTVNRQDVAEATRLMKASLCLLAHLLLSWRLGL